MIFKFCELVQILFETVDQTLICSAPLTVYSGRADLVTVGGVKYTIKGAEYTGCYRRSNTKLSWTLILAQHMKKNHPGLTE